MGFNFLDIFKDKSNRIVSVEEDEGIDYLDKLSTNPIGDLQNNLKSNVAEGIQLADNSIEEKIKSIRLVSGLSDEKINEFYAKMKVVPEAAVKMAKSVLEMLSDEEKKGKNANEIIELLEKKISLESLAKVTASFLVVVEEGKMDEILPKE